MHKQRKSVKCFFIAGMIFTLGACTPRKVVQYNPDDFISPNRIVTKKIPIHLPLQKVNATFGYGNDPEVVKAYEKFTKNGVAKNVNSKGFKTFAYDTYSRPLVTCAPLHLCVVQLERGEKINNIDLGDSAHWLVGTSLVGSPNDGSYQVAIKPKLYDVATDMVITTDKRTYNIGLVSKKGASTHVINFYYPEETLKKTVLKLHNDAASPMQRELISNQTHISLNNINFNYGLRGDYAAWRPERVFDDGNKTFIQMPGISEHVDLPVLYILNNRKLSLVNYRYKKPYYIIDGLFKTAYLVSGKGARQTRIEIDNKNIG